MSETSDQNSKTPSSADPFNNFRAAGPSYEPEYSMDGADYSDFQDDDQEGQNEYQRSLTSGDSQLSNPLTLKKGTEDIRNFTVLHKLETAEFTVQEVLHYAEIDASDIPDALYQLVDVVGRSLTRYLEFVEEEERKLKRN